LRKWLKKADKVEGLMMQKQKIKSKCWCYAAKKYVKIKGIIEGQRQADLLRITDCELEGTCEYVGSKGCFVGKLREGRW
jgi:hypothetical protein